MSDLDLPYPPHSVQPFIVGDDVPDMPLRLCIVNFYAHNQGVYKGAEVWARGSLVEQYIDGGQLTEIMSANTPDMDAPPPPADEPIAEPAEVTIADDDTEDDDD